MSGSSLSRETNTNNDGPVAVAQRRTGSVDDNQEENDETEEHTREHDDTDNKENNAEDASANTHVRGQGCGKCQGRGNRPEWD